MHTLCLLIFSARINSKRSNCSSTSTDYHNNGHWSPKIVYESIKNSVFDRQHVHHRECMEIFIIKSFWIYVLLSSRLCPIDMSVEEHTRYTWMLCFKILCNALFCIYIAFFSPHTTPAQISCRARWSRVKSPLNLYLFSFDVYSVSNQRSVKSTIIWSKRIAGPSSLELK